METLRLHDDITVPAMQKQDTCVCPGKDAALQQKLRLAKKQGSPVI